MSDKINSSELDQFDAEIREVEAEFVEMSLEENELGSEDLEEFAALEEEIKAAGILEPVEAGLSAMTEDDMDVQFLRGFLRRKVLNLIKKLIALVRRHGRRCARCAALLRRTIQLFRQGKYIAALRSAYATYRCIRRCVG